MDALIFKLVKEKLNSKKFDDKIKAIKVNITFAKQNI